MTCAQNYALPHERKALTVLNFCTLTDILSNCKQMVSWQKRM